MPRDAEEAGRLARIEDRLAAEDPAFVESFRRWRPPSGGHPGENAPVAVSMRTGLVLLVGLILLMLGPTLTLVLGTLVALGLGARALCRRCHDGPVTGGGSEYGTWPD